MEWFCEYEKYDGGEVFLGDYKKKKSSDMENSS